MSDQRYVTAREKARMGFIRPTAEGSGDAQDLRLQGKGSDGLYPSGIAHHELARHIAEAWCVRLRAVLDIGMAEANVTREGYHGKKVAGWTAGRYIDGGGWTIAKYVHNFCTCRCGSPSRHEVLLNRTKTADGKGLSIDGAE